jgi:hypothetical protein
MHDRLDAILGCLPFVLWLALVLVAYGWVTSKFNRGNSLLGRALRNTFRFTFVGPISATYRAVRWVTMKYVSAHPHYHFHQVFLDQYPVTPLQLFESIEAVFNERQIIGVQLSRVQQLEWNLLSGRRIYLLIRRRASVCYISAIPVGTGLFVAWRYSSVPPAAIQVVLQVPLLGRLAEWLFAPPTFYREDFYDAFEQAIRACVLEATDRLGGQGIRPLTEVEARPLLREFYA